MMHDMLQQAASSAMVWGQRSCFRVCSFGGRSTVVRAPTLSVDDKRAILAAWASRLTLWIPNRPSVKCREHQSRFRSMTCRLPSKNSIGAMVSNGSWLSRQCGRRY